MTGFWADVPPGRVAYLVGASPEAIALMLETLPADAPAVVTCRSTSVTAEPPSSRMVAAVLDQMEQAALDLYPAWLPGADAIAGPGGAGVDAVRALALEKASVTPHFGPFLADLASRAVGGGVRADRFARLPAEVRAAGLARVIADSFGRASLALLVVVPDGHLPTTGQWLLAAVEWLAHHGEFAVWLTGAGLTGAGLGTGDRVPTVPVRLPEHVASLAGDRAAEAVEAAKATETAEAAGPTASAGATVSGEATVTGRAVPAPEPAVLDFPAVQGRPHPASEAEQALEAALAAAPWAVGRVWNQTVQADPLTNPVRVDLMWPAERCAVEIDGDEHRGPLHYEADRNRDVLLQLAGFAVLRFTNRQTLADTGAVLSQLERFITTRRPKEDGHAR